MPLCFGSLASQMPLWISRHLKSCRCEPRRRPHLLMRKFWRGTRRLTVVEFGRPVVVLGHLPSSTQTHLRDLRPERGLRRGGHGVARRREIRGGGATGILCFWIEPRPSGAAIE